MIALENISKQYACRDGANVVLKGIDLTIGPGDKVGVLGRNGAGKSTLIRLISGVELPTSGTVRRQMRVSWPLAFAGGFSGSLTGLDNLRFICRVYGVSPEERVAYLEEFSELGRYLREPVKYYSNGMRARLAFGISMAIDFDCFLIDEVVAVGDNRFRERCERELFEKRADRARILVSHNTHYMREHCDRALVLDNGRLVAFHTVDDAIGYYEKICGN